MPKAKRMRGATIGIVLIGVFLGGGGIAQGAPGETGRICYTINDLWRFLPEGRSYVHVLGHDDSRWEEVNLPHTWNALDPFDEEPGYRRGKSWYRKELFLPDALRGKQIFLYFEGVHQVADVYVNGKPAGRHKGGYTAFAFDITDLVQFDRERNANLIAVRVDNSHDPEIPPLDIGYAHYGGIYRDVWLMATDPVHLDVLDHASPGIYVDTPEVSGERATVRVRGTVVNDREADCELQIVSTVWDAEGMAVARLESSLHVPARQSKAFTHEGALAGRPQLWSPEHPYLYRVSSVVQEAGRSLDEVCVRLGVRWFEFDPDRGFFLNGEHLALRGTNRHQDYWGLGSAVPNWVHRRDVEWVKGMGVNFLRLAHYPQDPVVLDTADELGLILWEEIPVVNYITVSEAFTENCKTMLREMIRQHYNHPSVVLWGIMNEVFLHSRQGERTYSFEGEEEYLAAVAEFSRQLDQVVRREDPARVSAMALHGGDIYNQSGVADITQVVGWNLYHGWYFGSFDGFGPFLDKQHELYPKRCQIVSEYGGGSDSRLHSLQPDRFDFTAEWQRLYHESHLRQIEARPYLAATAIWNQFDFSQPRVGESIPHVNQKGMLTFDRKPKDVYSLYQANLSREPVLHIASREWSHRTGTNPDAPAGAGRQPVEQPVQVYSNLDEVELFLAGRSLGVKKPDEVCSAIWQVPFRDGWNILEARGQRGEERLSDRVEVHFTYRAPTLADPSVPFAELAVNVGSNAQFIDAGHLVWEADQAYLPGGWGYVGGHTRQYDGSNRKSLEIFGTDEDPLYQTYREGLEAYRFDVPAGYYEVELRLADYPLEKPGQRVFHIDVGAQRLLENLDLVRDYGPRHAAVRTVRTRAHGNEGVVIRFERVSGEPILSAIRVRKLQ